MSHQRNQATNPVALVDYQPAGDTLQRFHDSAALVRCIIGPIGSSKTTGAIVDVLGMINDQVPDANGVRLSRWAVVRNTTVDLKASTIKDWCLVCPPQLGKLTLQPPITQRISYLHEDGFTRVRAEVLFLGFDTLDVKKIRGLQLTGVWCDEAKELPKEVPDMLLGRCGRYPPRRQVADYPYGMIWTSNAPARDEWLGKTVLETKPEGYEFFIQPGGVIKRGGKWVTNPLAENLENLPEGYYARQIANKKDDWIRSNLANEFVHVGTGRPVHPDFNERIHVADHDLEPTAGVDLHLGVDFGRTPAGVIGQRLATGQWVILDEIVTVNTSAFIFGKEVKRHIAKEYEGFAIGDGWGDPAGSQQAQTRDESCFDVLESVGVYLWPAPSNDFDLRTSALDNLLTSLVGGEPAILISPRCKTLVKGLAGAYQFKRIQVAGEDRFRDKPDKGPESHVVEALHYLLMGEGEGDALINPEFMNEFESVNRDGGWAPEQSQFE